MTKVTLGLLNYWRMADTGDGIIPRELILAEICLTTLLGIRRGWHYNRGQYSGGASLQLSSTVASTPLPRRAQDVIIVIKTSMRLKTCPATESLSTDMTPPHLCELLSPICT